MSAFIMKRKGNIQVAQSSYFFMVPPVSFFLFINADIITLHSLAFSSSSFFEKKETHQASVEEESKRCKLCSTVIGSGLLKVFLHFHYWNRDRRSAQGPCDSKKKMKKGKLWAQIRWKKTMLSIASEKKETIGSMADARSYDRSNRLFFSLMRRS